LTARTEKHVLKRIHNGKPIIVFNELPRLFSLSFDCIFRSGPPLDELVY